MTSAPECQSANTAHWAGRRHEGNFQEGCCSPHLSSSPRVSGRGRAGSGRKAVCGACVEQGRQGALVGTRGAAGFCGSDLLWPPSAVLRLRVGGLQLTRLQASPNPHPSQRAEGGESTLPYDLEEVACSVASLQRGLFKCRLHPHLATKRTWLFVFRLLYFSFRWFQSWAGKKGVFYSSANSQALPTGILSKPLNILGLHYKGRAVNMTSHRQQ